MMIPFFLPSSSGFSNCMTKTCSKCNIEKLLSEFNKRKDSKKDGLQARCRVCTRKRSKEHYYSDISYYTKKRAKRRKQIRLWIQSFKKGKPCLDCGEIFPVVCMDFDHIDDNKDFNISSDGLSKSKKAILEEIKKCEIVCSNCHRLRTYNRLYSPIV